MFKISNATKFFWLTWFTFLSTALLASQFFPTKAYSQEGSTPSNEEVQSGEVDQLFISDSIEAGSYCTCLYPFESDLRGDEQQEVAHGIWEVRQITFSGNTVEQFVCNIPEFAISSRPIGVRISEDSCERPRDL